MAVPLLLTAAVPFCLPAQEEDQSGLDELNLYLSIVEEASSAVQFVLGPRHRSRATISPAFTVVNPEAKLRAPRTPPNSPNTNQSFVFPDIIHMEDDANDADQSDDSSDEKQKEENIVLDNRKRKRIGSFSGAKPHLRRVPNKKVAPKNIIAPPPSFANTSQLPSQDVTDSSPLKTIPSSDTLLLASPLSSERSNLKEHLSRLSNFQKEAEETSEETWSDLGKELRAIADKFEQRKMDKVTAKKEMGVLRDSLESFMPNSVWAFIFWKLFDKFR